MGHNEIHPELINKASPEFLNTLVIFMNAFFQLCHLPLKGITKPIVKDTEGNKTDIENYRQIMTSNCILKLFELLLLIIL